jgi:hypothetical protein
MSPRSQAAAISGGRRLRISTDAFVLQRREQRIMRGRDERHGNLLAGEVGDLGDAGTVAGDERFGFADQADDEDRLDGQIAAGGGGERAGAYIADVDRAGGDRRDDVSAGIEFAPVDGSAERLFIDAVGLRHLGGLDDRLVADGELQVFSEGRT